jgi:hypothetical protein
MSREFTDPDPPPFPPYLVEDFPELEPKSATWIPGKPSGMVGNGHREAVCKLPA